MTVLNYAEAVNFSRQEIWRHFTGFSKELPRFLHWIEKVEYLGGNSPELGGVWRFYIVTNAGLWRLDMEITEWLEGERVALTPLGNSGIFEDIQLFQILVELKDKPNDHTQIKILCEYEPVSKLGRLRNLAFQRRSFLDLIAQSVDALSRVVVAEAWLQVAMAKKY